MARKPNVTYWASRGGYGCWISGQQHILARGPDDAPQGPTYLAALARFQDLLSHEAAGHAGDANTVRVVLAHHLQYVEERKKKSTYRIRQRAFEQVCDVLGDVQMKNLTHFMLYEFFARQRQDTGRRSGPKKNRTCRWTDGSVRNCIDSLQAAFNWAVRSGLISKNPLKGIEKPSPRSRGRDALISPADHKALMGAVSPALRLVLQAMENTGARPSEIISARASDWDERRGAIVYHAEHKRKEGEYSHKTGKKGKDRVIRFTGGTLVKVRELVAQRQPGEHIFQPSARHHQKSARGRWLLREIDNRFTEARAKLGWKGRHIVAYSYRHTYATRMLEAGISVEVLAGLMGTSAKMIREHYSHVAENDDYMRQQLEQFRGRSALEDV